MGRTTRTPVLLLGLAIGLCVGCRPIEFNNAAVDQWIAGQSLAGTPLVRSYQITPRDPRVPDATQNFLPYFANTYDNALFGLSSLFSGSQSGVQRARDILSYYDHATLLPYRSNLESVVISGELLYVGLLAAQYDQKTGDHQFAAMMQRFDNYVLDPNLDLHGALKGGPAQPWASTENNLDALSYLELRYQMLLQRNQPGDINLANQLRARQQRIASWLVNSAYIAGEGRFRRGDNDNIYSSDTSFLGIDVLTDLKKYDPDFYSSSGLSAIDLPGLMSYAENHAMVTDYPYLKPDGTTVSIQGFRYQDQAASPISFEWTAMAVRAYQDLGETLKAYLLQQSLRDAMIANSDGSQTWAYAASPGNTFNDSGGWFATSYPGVSSTIWSTIALAGFPPSWPFSFGGVAPALPTSSTANPSPVANAENASIKATDNPIFSSLEPSGGESSTKRLSDFSTDSTLFIVSPELPDRYRPLMDKPGTNSQANLRIMMSTPRTDENYTQLQIRSSLSHEAEIALPSQPVH